MDRAALDAWRADLQRDVRYILEFGECPSSHACPTPTQCGWLTCGLIACIPCMVWSGVWRLCTRPWRACETKSSNCADRFVVCCVDSTPDRHGLLFKEWTQDAQSRRNIARAILAALYAYRSIPTTRRDHANHVRRVLYVRCQRELQRLGVSVLELREACRCRASSA